MEPVRLFYWEYSMSTAVRTKSKQEQDDFEFLAQCDFKELSRNLDSEKEYHIEYFKSVTVTEKKLRDMEPEERKFYKRLKKMYTPSWAEVHGLHCCISMSASKTTQTKMSKLVIDLRASWVYAQAAIMDLPKGKEGWDWWEKAVLKAFNKKLYRVPKNTKDLVSIIYLIKQDSKEKNNEN